MFHIITGLTALYVYWSFVRLLPWPRRPKVLFGVLLILVAEHHLITRHFFGSMASPEIPFLMLVLLGWLFGALVLLACLLLIKDVLGGLIYLVSERTTTLGFAMPRLHYGLGVVALVLAAVGVWESVRVPDVKTVEVVLPTLPSEFDGFKLVQLTDLHASRLLQGPWIEAVVAKTNALEPDLTVLTGDMIDGSPEARAADVPPLKALSAKHGVYAILGNHEYYVEYLNWLPVFEELGLHMLFNEHVKIEHENHHFVLAGVTDNAAASVGQPAPDIHAALSGVQEDETVILLAHRPTHAVQYAQAGADLQLSGHTHGGQALGLHWLVKQANAGFVSGLYAVQTMQLYVSNGAGLWNGFPIRLGRRSEITQIVLRSGLN